MSQPNLASAQAGKTRLGKKSFLTEKRRDAVVCLSLANFCFVRVWGEVLAYGRSEAVWVKTIPSPADYAAVMTAVLLLAALLYGSARMARRHLGDRGIRVARFASFALAALPLNGIRAALSPLTIYLKSPMLNLIVTRTALLFILPACAAVLWLAWRFQRRVSAAATVSLVTLSPFCLLTFGESLAAMIGYPGQPYRDGPLTPRLATAPPATRVVWIVFDEWDYRLTFLDRPRNLAMPEVDRLRTESLFATAARSPAMDTATSLPSLITGRRLEAVSRESGSGMAIEPVGSRSADAAPWDDSSSVFYAARKSGFDVGLVGWYLPYCRTMNSVLSECAWCTLPVQANSAGNSFLAGFLGTGFWGKVAGQSVSLLETDSLSPFGQSSSTRRKVQDYLELLAASKKDVADPGLGLVFLHLPVPHAPHAYDRFTGRLDGANRSIAGYVDSLALMDRTLGELRAAMERHGVWDHTVLLIGADHPFRSSKALDGKSDPRVPFLLRFPGRPTAGVCGAEFDTIVSASLVYSILRGSVSTLADASNYIERHHADRESPVRATD